MPVMYAGELIADERVAILELIDYLECEIVGDGVHLITKKQIEGLQFVYFRSLMDLEVVDVRTEPQIREISANRDSLFGTNYQVSRSWAQHIHKKPPKYAGIRYAPVRYGDTDAGAAVAFFGNRIPPSAFELLRPPVPCTSSEGRQVFFRCGPETRLYPK